MSRTAVPSSPDFSIETGGSGFREDGTLKPHIGRRESISPGEREGQGHPWGWAQLMRTAQWPVGVAWAGQAGTPLPSGPVVASGGAAGRERDWGTAPGLACLHPTR